jgi:hypothetical protein
MNNITPIEKPNNVNKLYRENNLSGIKYTHKKLLYSKKKSIAERVINLEAESKATQQAIALLKQMLFEFARARQDNLARERERRF